MSRAGLTTAEVRALFTHLEVEGGPRRAGGGGGDASGVAPWQALLDATRPRLSGERLELVRLAFGRMDREGKGDVPPETVTQRSGDIHIYIIYESFHHAEHDVGFFLGCIQIAVVECCARVSLIVGRSSFCVLPTVPRTVSGHFRPYGWTGDGPDEVARPQPAH